MSKELVGWWIIVLVPIFLGIAHGLSEHRKDFITERILVASTVGAAILFFFGACLYAPNSGHFYSVVLCGLFGFALFAFLWEQFFKILGGIASKYRSTGE